MRRVCGCCKLEGDVETWESSQNFHAATTDDSSFSFTFVSIWNQRESAYNWICGACLCEKLGINEKHVRGGYF